MRFIIGHHGRKYPLVPEAPRPCACGCGGRTSVYRNRARRFIRGHQPFAVITRDDFVVEDRGYETACWVWKGTPGGDDRGKVQRRGRKMTAYRAMYEQELGPIAPGLVLDHLCRVPGCIRPDHLDPVTHAENVRRGDATKLTHAKADAIRALYETGVWSHRDLAGCFNVGRTTVSDVLANKRWHLRDPLREG